MSFDDYLDLIGITLKTLYTGYPFQVPWWIIALFNASAALLLIWGLWWFGAKLWKFVIIYFWNWAYTTVRKQSPRTPDKGWRTFRDDARIAFVLLFVSGCAAAAISGLRLEHSNFQEELGALFAISLVSIGVFGVWFVVKFSRYAWIRRKDFRGLFQENTENSNKNFFDNIERTVIWFSGLRPIFKPARVGRWIVFALLMTVLTQSLLAANGYIFSHYLLNTSSKYTGDYYFTDEGFQLGMKCKVAGPAGSQTVRVYNTAAYGFEAANVSDLRVFSGSWLTEFWPEVARQETARSSGKGWSMNQFKHEYQILFSAKDELLECPLRSGAELEQVLASLKNISSVTFNPKSKLLNIADKQGGWSEELYCDDKFKVLIKDDKIWLCRCSNFGAGLVNERIFHWDPTRGVSTSSLIQAIRHSKISAWSIPILIVASFVGILLITAPFCWLTYKGPPIVVNEEESLP